MRIKHDFQTHRCKQSLDANCSIRKYPKSSNGLMHNLMDRDGQWHLYSREVDFDYDVTYMSHVSKILYCPFCGEKLQD